MIDAPDDAPTDDVGRSSAPAPGAAPEGNAIEALLAKKANDAISAGADPAAASAMLGTMVRHLRANPAHMASANTALSSGADPNAVAATAWQLAQQTDPMARYHRAFQSGRLQQNNADLGAGEQVGAADYANIPAQALETVASGVPGAKAVIAAGRTATGQGSYRDNVADVEHETSDAGLASTIGKGAGAIALTPLLAPLGIVAGGAALGGASEALSPDADESWKMRALKTAGGAAAGALLGRAGKTVADAAERFGAESGLTDYLGGKIPAALQAVRDRLGLKMATGADDMGAATGTEGAANRFLAKSAPLRDAAGKADASQSAIDRAEQFDAAWKAKYAAAAANPKVIDDPTVNRMLADPDLQKAFQAASRILDADNVARPGAAVPATAASKILGPNGAPAVPAVEGSDAVPTPELLHLTKRIAQDVVDRGFNQESTIPLEDALRIQPKVDALRQALHQVSPEYKAADNFFQLGMTARKAVGLGYGAVKPAMQNPSNGNLETKTPVAVGRWADTRTNPDPAQASALRDVAEAGVQLGARQQGAQQAAQAPLTGGFDAMLSRPIFSASPAAAGQRAMLNVPGLEETIGNARETAADEAARLVPGKMPFVGRAGVYDYLKSGPGQNLLQRLSSQSASFPARVAQYGAGSQQQQQLQAYLRAAFAGATAPNP